MNRLEWTEKNLDDLFARYEKLLEFVKSISHNEWTGISKGMKEPFELFGDQAKDLLHEIGEL
jgi:hypothetical protein